MAFVLRMRPAIGPPAILTGQGGAKTGSTHGKISCPIRRHMAQSAWVRHSRSIEPTVPESRGILGAIECPKCHSDDVIRSRRKLAERLVLPVLRAQVYRCRDCKNRFWVGVQWRFVILGFLSAAVAGGFAMAIMFAHQTREQQAEEANAPKQVQRRYRAPRTVLPKGLPPLSSIPRAKDDPALATPATH